LPALKSATSTPTSLPGPYDAQITLDRLKNISATRQPLKSGHHPTAASITLAPIPEIEREIETDNLLLDKQLAELKKCNDAFIARCQRLGINIDVMQASIHLLQPFKNDSASNSGRSRRAHVKLHPASPQHSPGYIKSPGVNTSREFAGSHDIQTLAAPTINREIGDFLQSLQRLQVAMENRAIWLGDEISAQEGVVCHICLEKWPEGDLIPVDNCKHEFCLECFRAYIISKIQEQQYPILCPTCVADRVKGGEPQSIAISISEALSTDPHIPRNQSRPCQEVRTSTSTHRPFPRSHHPCNIRFTGMP
jgi:hypothetical protein